MQRLLMCFSLLLLSIGFSGCDQIFGPAPVIQSLSVTDGNNDPAPDVWKIGQISKFSVTATGLGSLSYRWKCVDIYNNAWDITVENTGIIESAASISLPLDETYFKNTIKVFVTDSANGRTSVARYYINLSDQYIGVVLNNNTSDKTITSFTLTPHGGSSSAVSFTPPLSFGNRFFYYGVNPDNYDWQASDGTTIWNWPYDSSSSNYMDSSMSIGSMTVPRLYSWYLVPKAKSLLSGLKGIGNKSHFSVDSSRIISIDMGVKR
jgi:hypothetical protein